MHRRAASGQALVMGMVVLFMGTLTLFYLFSTGQVSADKQRVTNAADAAAYSAALWRARVLNYDAYSNRAMIVNEVAIAQSLTLTSETQYLKNFALCMAQQPGDGGDTCHAAISYLAQIYPPLSRALSAAAAGLGYYDGALHSVLDAEVTARSQAANRLLSASQTALDVSTNFLAVEKVVDQVTTANDAKFSAHMLPDTFEGPGGFTKQYQDTNRIRVANLTRQGLDQYSQDRGFTTPFLPCIPLSLQYKKRGGTTLDSSLDRWEAADDLSEWVFTYKFPASCNKTENPMGWGDRQASGGTSDQDTGHVNDNPKALQIARGRDAEFSPDGYAGVQPFRDLNYAGLEGSDAQVKNPMFTLGVVVHLGGTNLRTANTLDIGVGRMRMTEDLNKGELSSVAAAQVYFKRPIDRNDHKVEYPSLFNPYWQARLAEPTIAQRAAALLL